jgi:hypothetical protein
LETNVKSEKAGLLLQTAGGNALSLLVVGFYLINIGFVTLALKYGDKATNPQTAVEILSSKVGLVLVVLGFMHFFNLYVFSRMRRRGLKPPVIAHS